MNEWMGFSISSLLYALIFFVYVSGSLCLVKAVYRSRKKDRGFYGMCLLMDSTYLVTQFMFTAVVGLDKITVILSSFVSVLFIDTIVKEVEKSINAEV